MSRVKRETGGAVVALLLMLVFAGVTRAQTVVPEVATPTPTATAIPALMPAETAEPNIGRLSLTIDLGDFQTPAEITYPLDGSGPFPTVLLIHGSGAVDMDLTLYAPGSTDVVSQIFRDIGDDLPQHGYAVVRYNKHYVRGADDVDTAGYATLDLNQMKADAETVIDTVKLNPLVDPAQLYVYGWSEGSTVAAALVGENPGKYAGLILQAPVTVPWRDLLLDQVTKYAVPYLESFAPDGKITPDVLEQALAGDGGLAAKSALSFVISPGYAESGVVAANPQFDRNGDGIVEIATELTPVIERLLDGVISPNGPLGLYAPENALPPTTEQAAALALPVLVLQGERDASVTPSGAVTLAGKLAAAGNTDFHVILYPTLGHTLGEVPSAMQDNFPPIAAQPLADMVTWLDQTRGLDVALESLPTATPS